MRNTLGFISLIFGSLFMVIGSFSTELMPTTTMDIMTAHDWLNVTTQVIMPMFVGAVLMFVAVIVIR